MNRRAKCLSGRIETNKIDEVAFVEDLSGDHWKSVCKWEKCSVGVTARHLGAGHITISGMLEMIEGKDLPQITKDQINTMSKKDSHVDCTKTKALVLLRTNGAELAAFVAELTDDELDRKGSMPLLAVWSPPISLSSTSYANRQSGTSPA